MIGGMMKVAARLTTFLALLLLSRVAAFAHPAWGIVADAQGRVYFSDLEQVWRLDPDGRLTLFRPSRNAHVHELALAPNGDVIGTQNAYDSATETYSSGLWRRTPRGQETWPVPMSPYPPKGSGPWLDHSGNEYVSQWVSNDDHRVMLFRRSPAGRVDLLFGDPAAAARFRQEMAADIGGLVMASDGAILFADGSVVRRVAPGEAGLYYDGGGGASLRGLALAPDGTLLAADLAGHRLVAVGPDGRAAILYRGTAGWGPTGVALAGGRVLVLEAEEDPTYRSNRVRVVEVRDGKARLAAAPGGPDIPAVAMAAAAPGQRSASNRLALFAALGTAMAAALGLSLWAVRGKDEGTRLP